jgi:D-glycero-beta-D-manno-heptose 1-phosphate adenylyltransferase
MHDAPAFFSKIVDPAALSIVLPNLAVARVFTNGVFDILHTGHVTYLAQARAMGSSLIVAVNTDESVRRLGKGVDRPLNKLIDRVSLLAALGCVDLVTWFDEDTPYELIKLLRPNVLVKGGDYDMTALPESSLVTFWGGRAVTLPFVNGYSTTALLQKIRG